MIAAPPARLTELLERYQQTMASLASNEGWDPLPRGPSDFLLAWLREALPFVDDYRALALLHHQAIATPTDWAGRFHAAPGGVGQLFRLDLGAADLPRFRTGLDAFFARCHHFGIPASGRWGMNSADELLTAFPRVLDLHPYTFFGRYSPLVVQTALDQQALADELERGVSPEALFDATMAAPILHELFHGPDREWTGGPGSWTVMEACSAWIGFACVRAHVLAERAGEPGIGLRRALMLGEALVDELGEAAVWRLSLDSHATEDVIEPLATNLLVAAEWQHWLDGGGPAFIPNNRDPIPWIKLLHLACRCPDRIEGMQRIVGLAQVGPAVASELPDLLQQAATTPWSQLPCWREEADDDDLRRIDRVVATLFQVERCEPNLRVIPSDPPNERLVLDVERAVLWAEVRPDDAYGDRAEWLFPRPLCRGLYDRGLRRLTLTGCTRAAKDRVVEALRETCLATDTLSEEKTLDL